MPGDTALGFSFTPTVLTDAMAEQYYRERIDFTNAWTSAAFLCEAISFWQGILYVERGTFLLGDRIIFFTGVKYFFHNLNVWRVHESKKNNNILFIWLVTPPLMACGTERKLARES